MRLAALHTYPVKGCRRLDHDDARVEPWGLAGDRRWMVIDADGLGVTQREATALVGLLVEPRDGGLLLRAAGRPDLRVAEPTRVDPLPVRVFSSRQQVAALPAGPAADAWLSALLDRPVRLVHLARPARHVPVGQLVHDTGDQVSFADEYPLLLANAASLDALNGWLADAGEQAVPMSRFRPNLVVVGAPAWAEDGWVGRRLRIGSAWFRAGGTCGRCVVTTTDQETGVRGKEPLHTLGRRRNVDGKLRFGLNLVPEGPGAVRVGDPLIVAG
ncbi:MOSC N-terminal beta barrel domain-containing protein [Micromonospora sp. B11E3]|uniref:MOSC domain-containing protein n=1 Tax=Micromonospora sp. B11E3 TaxID=3153562 RepID=UPI00325EEA45